MSTLCPGVLANDDNVLPGHAGVAWVLLLPPLRHLLLLRVGSDGSAWSGIRRRVCSGFGSESWVADLTSEAVDQSAARLSGWTWRTTAVVPRGRDARRHAADLLWWAGRSATVVPRIWESWSGSTDLLRWSRRTAGVIPRIVLSGCRSRQWRHRHSATGCERWRRVRVGGWQAKGHPIARRVVVWLRRAGRLLTGRWRRPGRSGLRVQSGSGVLCAADTSEAATESGGRGTVHAILLVEDCKLQIANCKLEMFRTGHKAK